MKYDYIQKVYFNKEITDRPLTVTHPTLNDMAVLGSIVLIRTVISYFLDREIEAFQPPGVKKNDA